MSNKTGKQTTLLQTWGYEGNMSQRGKHEPTIEEAFHGDDSDDDLFAQLEEEFPGSNRNDPVHFEELPPISLVEAKETLPGFDLEAGRTWIYPTNYPVREYQFNIVKSCLYENTLVSLPTGLGKTFIAAVVMYNFFRWYPQGKIVFMAPTKPLVAQQIEACYNIMGVPQSETAEMTGNVSIGLREKAWKQKRVFFLTPQVMSNDLSRGLFPATHVKLLVVDEAHRAQGEYAYCQVVRELQRAKAAFRVVALSATPGSDLQAVRLMLQNLIITRIELRSEESPDIVPYTFQRTIEKIVVPVGQELESIKQKFLTILEVFIRRLSKASCLSRRGNSTNPLHYTKFGLITARNEFRQNPPARMDNYQKGVAESDFASAMSLYHGYELLMQHGMRAFFNFMVKAAGETPNTSLTNGSPGASSSLATSPGINRRLRYDLLRIPAWNEIANTLKEKFCQDSSESRLNLSRPQLLSQFGPSQKTEEKEFILGHPKLEKLRDVVIDHFQKKKEVATRVMIFSQYRDSVTEIAAMLHRHKPLVKVMEFVGQSGTNGKKGLSQKEQIEVVRRFKEGGYNTLVATCVGEEGLDIGEVDLIVCYDVSKSPIRLVQRMGRTGRKRAGRIVVLVTQGKEEQTYNQSMYCKNSINKAILEKQKLINFLSVSPRMVPNGIDPVCHKMMMKVGLFSKKTSNSIAPDKNKKITSMIKKVDKATSYRKSCGYLTDAELDDYLSMYPQAQDLFNQAPGLRPRRELWNMETNTILEDMFKSNGENYYNLSEWNMWQGTDAPRFYVSKSKTADIYCDILNPNPTLTKEPDDEVIIIEPPQSPLNVDDDPVILENWNGIDSALEDILGEDSYRHQYDYENIDQYCPSPDKIDAILSQMVEKFDLSSALRSFRRAQKKMEDRSPSPVFLSQSQLAQSTPATAKDRKRIVPEDLTPVAKKSLKDDFDDSFVHFSREEEPKSSKSLYGATQLASMLQNSHSSNENDVFPESHGDFESLIRNLSDHENRRNLSDQENRRNLSAHENRRNLSDHENPVEADFQIVSEGFFEELEKMFAFKLPNLQDFETRTKTTPKSKKAELSPSPLRQASKLKKKRAVLSSSEDEDREQEHEKPKPKKKRKINRFIQDEAELSGSASEDEEAYHDDLDGLDESFVDDATQRDDIDQKAIYLQSIRSPKMMKKMSLKPINHAEIFSQAPTDSMLMDEYEEDSFVVQNDEIEYESSTNDELDFVEEFGQPKKSEKAKPEKVKKRKRIIFSDSDSEESEKMESEKSAGNNLEEELETKDVSDSSRNSTDKFETSMTSESSQNYDVSVLVSAQEVHRSTEILSLLRHSHHINVHVQAKFEGAGFLLSSRLAVCRVNNSDFCNGAQRHKIVNSVQTMNEYFERPFLIVESNSDPFLESRQHRTKYVDMIAAQLAQSNIRLLFSNGPKESAEFMSALARKEAKKGFSLPANMKLPLLSEKYMSFYTHLPGVSYALALQMALTFKTPAELATGAKATLVRRLKLDEKRADKLHKFCRSIFQSDMTAQ